uniref:Transposase-associated domain-containing protein n=2 Tax=Chenopodium quinoa TaxID=63459 RepID=A0A803N5A9_CHEQI
MDSGAKEWWMFAKWCNEYERGVDEYVQKAFSSKSQGNPICYPCESCHYRFWRHEGVVRDHLICNGFVPRMDKLSELGISIEREQNIFDNDERSNPNDFNDNIVGLLYDARDAFRNGLIDEAKKFFKLVEEGQEDLYVGFKNHSKLSFMIRLFILKCDHKITNVAFGDKLELIREVLPDAKLPASFNEAKSVLKVLGLDYTKIDVCPNDCMIYWEEHENATSCHIHV